MIHLEPLSLNSARALIDFGGGSEAAQAFEGMQLKGAVALHNLLAGHGFAYLADEVGMGKTYIALGVAALIRHFHPESRILVIAPRENIQNKWRNEMRKFCGTNWRIANHRVRTFDGAPARAIRSCRNLADLAHACIEDANRDFIVRLPSFSFGLGEEQTWRQKRDDLRKLLPWIPESALALHSKEGFKDAYAEAINAVLPHFDLVIVDEGHNLKHGRGPGTATRNRILSTVLGGGPLQLQGGGAKADRVLVLSATPIEGDFRELWNQMDIVGKGNVSPTLRDDSVPMPERRELARQFLVRRLTGLMIGGHLHTKNLYRREWRGGGVELHDDPFELADERQRLIVALVQKKVADVLGEQGRSNGARFKRSFQLGMLASFESFAQTAKVSTGEAAPTFEDSEQTEADHEKHGVDTESLGQLAGSYRERFGVPMPHPKMDSVAEALSASLREGQKSLVFVRRIASVTELGDKVGHEYDLWLRNYLAARLPPSAQGELERAFAQYWKQRPRLIAQSRSDGDVDEGGADTFFAWFFRGDGPRGWLSGAAFRKNRLSNPSARYSLLFHDNYVAALLGSATVSAFAYAVGLDVDTTRSRLRSIAARAVRSSSQRVQRRPLFHAYQVAALQLLSGSRIGDRARVILQERYPEASAESVEPSADFPQPDDSLATETLFTLLRQRPTLYEALWPSHPDGDFRVQFVERERRRELLAAAMQLGHPMVDLWRLAIGSIGSMAEGERDDTGGTLAEDFLNELETQRAAPSGLDSWTELEAIARNYRLIVDVNFPELREKSISELATYFGSILGHQTPVGRMSGGVNNRLVRQFRMPGYPIVLVTTDVLQEGEDLHTFCSRVVHYGMGYTPSGMEQRAGRVDRIGSLTHRRLSGALSAEPGKLLQLYYPFLADTVEAVQVHEVFRRMNRFIDLLHDRLGATDTSSTSIDLAGAFAGHLPMDIAPILEPLKSAFDVQPEWLRGRDARPAVSPDVSNGWLSAFEALASAVAASHAIEWKAVANRQRVIGTAWLSDGHLLFAGDPRTRARQQPLTVILRPTRRGHGLACSVVSPIGVIDQSDDDTSTRVMELQRRLDAKICAVSDERQGTYNLTARTDLWFQDKLTSVSELLRAIEVTCACADTVERVVLRIDQPLAVFESDLVREGG